MHTISTYFHGRGGGGGGGGERRSRSSTVGMGGNWREKKMGKTKLVHGGGGGMRKLA